MGLAKFDVELQPGGPTRVTVNGDDIGRHVRSLHMAVRHGEIPRLVLELSGEGSLSGEGIIEVAGQPTEEEIGAYLIEWLGEQDPDDLTQSAMADAPMSVSPTEAILNELRRRAASS